MRFVLVKGRSQYGSLRLHADQLAAALRLLGQAVEIVDLVGPEGTARLVAAAGASPDCVFGFSGVGAEVAVPGRFFDSPGFVYASLYVDHPAHHLGRLEMDAPRRVVFFLDHTHVAFARLWAAPGAFSHIGFLPPGANTLPTAVDTSDAAFAARDIALLFTGTYRGAPAAAWADWPQSPARALVSETSRRMAQDATLPLLEALQATLADSGAALGADLLRSAAPLLSPIQLYAEAHHRHRVLTALGEAGAPLSVYGAGWEPLCAAYPSFRFGGVGSFEETLALMRRTRVALNINNGFVAGGHERVFGAMCAGAAVVSEASGYYAEAFGEGSEIATFDVDPPDALAARLDRLLAEPNDALAAMARAGHARAMAEHRWDSRAAALIEAVRACL